MYILRVFISQVFKNTNVGGFYENNVKVCVTNIHILMYPFHSVDCILSLYTPMNGSNVSTHTRHR